MTPQGDMNRPKTDHWKEELERFLKSSPNRDPAELMKDLRNLGAAIGDERVEELLTANPHFLAYGPALSRAFHNAIINNEISQTRELLQQEWGRTTSFPKVASPTSTKYYYRADHMFDNLDFHDCRRMVHVGCGWMPVILFRVHDMVDSLELVGLDIVPDAVETASKLANHLGYDRVKVELEDGCSYDYRNAQIVYIVSMVSPLSVVLARIADTAPDNVRVLVGGPYELGRLWIDAVEPSIDPRFEFYGMGQVLPTALNRDVYLRRRPDALSLTGQNGQPGK